MFKKTKLFNIPIPKFGTFEEINLRFYVVRKENNTLKREVVFINETIPYSIVLCYGLQINCIMRIIQQPHKLNFEDEKY